MPCVPPRPRLPQHPIASHPGDEKGLGSVRAHLMFSMPSVRPLRPPLLPLERSPAMISIRIFGDKRRFHGRVPLGRISGRRAARSACRTTNGLFLDGRCYSGQQALVITGIYSESGNLGVMQDGGYCALAGVRFARVGGCCKACRGGAR